MVAYSFNTAFVDRVASGTKRQTIRLPRKRHARPGEEIQLYHGMRTRHCRLLGKSTVESVHEIRIDLVEQTITIDDAIVINEIDELDAFALSDGFDGLRGRIEPWEHMHRWWCMIHPGEVFAGVLIKWGDLKAPEVAS